MALVHSAAFEGFCVELEVGRFMDEFPGGLSYLHKRKIMRFTRPDPEPRPQRRPTASSSTYEAALPRS